MRRIIIRRLAQIIPLIFAVIVMNFVLIHLAPGSLFDVMTSEQQITDPAMLDQLRHTYGVDQPTSVQLAKYIWSVMRLDLGYSYRQNAPVLDVIMQQLPARVIETSSKWEDRRLPKKAPEKIKVSPTNISNRIARRHCSLPKGMAKALVLVKWMCRQPIMRARRNMRFRPDAAATGWRRWRFLNIRGRKVA